MRLALLLLALPLCAEEVLVFWTASAETNIVAYNVFWQKTNCAMCELRTTNTAAVVSLAPGMYALGVSAINVWGLQGEVAWTALTVAPALWVTNTVLTTPALGQPWTVLTQWCFRLTPASNVFIRARVSLSRP